MRRCTVALFALSVLVATSCRTRARDVADAAPSAAPLTSASASPLANPDDAGPADAAVDTTRASTTDPFGVAKSAAKVTCKALLGKHVAERDLLTSFVDGNDLLALVNRSPQGQLSSDFVPADLVEIPSGREVAAGECDKIQCLRKEAAAALGELLGEMKRLGFPGKVESAYRGYSTQCGTFLRWASKGTFCEATEQSALPGHSQHQLGTTVDLFTEEWAKDPRGVFREGFGCTPAGAFLQEHAWDFGFVMPYPIHPDDRHPKQKCVVRWDIPVPINPKTGYRFEHWHIRYVGRDAAKRFEKAYRASGPGTPGEITVEQWLRAEKHISGGDVELPVCDGCNCGACATLAEDGEGTCDHKRGSYSLHLDAHGRPTGGGDAPRILGVKHGVKKWHGNLPRPDGSTAVLAPQVVVEVKVDVPERLFTQPPIGGFEAFAGYTWSSTFQKLAPYPETEPRAFPPLEHAWMVGIEPSPNETGVAFPWRAGLGLSAHGSVYDRANVLLPAKPGSSSIRVLVPSGAPKVKVVMLEGGVPRGAAVEHDLR